MDESSRASKRRLVWLGALALVAVAAVIYLANDRSRPTGEEEHLRVFAPRLDDTVTSAELRFVWQASAPEAQYRLHVLTAEGERFWSTTTRDTTAHLPDGASLEPGSTYIWLVDAIRSAGRSSTTGPQRFTISP